MTAPLSWLHEAYERRNALLAQGASEIHISVSVWGVTMWAVNVPDAIGRSWSAIEAASTNPLVPTLETLAQRSRRAAA